LYLGNIIKFIIISLIILFIYYRTQKFVARKAGAIAEIDLWKQKRIILPLNPFRKKKTSLPLWLVVPLIVTLLSNGQIFFAAVFSIASTVKPAYRIGRKYPKLTEFEHAKIAVSSPLLLILLALILSSLPILKDVVLVSSMVAIFSMVPLPGLPGTEVFFGSKPLYIFSLVFILIIAVLLKLPYFTSVLALIIALIIAIAIVFFYLWNFYRKR